MLARRPTPGIRLLLSSMALSASQKIVAPAAKRVAFRSGCALRLFSGFIAAVLFATWRLRYGPRLAAALSVRSAKAA